MSKTSYSEVVHGLGPSPWRIMFPNRSAPAILAISLMLALPSVAQQAAAQQADRTRPYGVTRPMAEQDIVRMRSEKGEIRTLDELMPRAYRAAGPQARYIGVEPSQNGLTYRFKFQRPDGRLVWVDMDGRTGSVLSVR